MSVGEEARIRLHNALSNAEMVRIGATGLAMMATNILGMAALSSVSSSLVILAISVLQQLQTYVRRSVEMELVRVSLELHTQTTLSLESTNAMMAMSFHLMDVMNSACLNPALS